MTGETNETTASVPDTEEAAVPTPVPASEAEDTSASTSADNEAGKALYTKCASCHGPDGKTKALGKSEVIAGQSAPDLETKIAEYKAGTRDVAGMGALMKGQVATLSDDDIKAVAAYISTL